MATLELGAHLARYQRRATLFMVPFGELQRRIIAFVPADYRMIIYRRCMMRILNRIAAQVGAKAIVTGDAVGQAPNHRQVVRDDEKGGARALAEVADQPHHAVLQAEIQRRQGLVGDDQLRPRRRIQPANSRCTSEGKPSPKTSR
mgnify:CR=1 FL=1